MGLHRSLLLDLLQTLRQELKENYFFEIISFESIPVLETKYSWETTSDKVFGLSLYDNGSIQIS